MGAVMATTITSRILASPTAANSKRVAYNGDVVGASFDGWGGSWGDAWGDAWSVATVGTAASPAIDVTARIGSAPTANNTKRVTFA